MTLHRITKEADDFHPDAEESEAVTEVWASIETTGGDEATIADGQTDLTRVKLTLRWGQTIAACNAEWYATRDNEVTGETERYDFKAVDNVGGRNREFVIEAVKAG